MSIQNDHWDCKGKFIEIIEVLKRMYDEDALTPESLGAFKKELITALKDFEKKYVNFYVW